MNTRFGRLPAALLVAALLLAGAGPARALEIQKVVSPGGIEAWLVEDHKVPVIAVEFSFAGGAAADPAGKEGLANLTADLLDEGAGDLDSQSFAKRLQDDAISVSFQAGSDDFRCGLRTLSEHQDAAWDLMALALSRPRFDAEAVERVRAAVISDIRQSSADPSKVARDAFYARLFPGHPYGRDDSGTVESVSKLTADDLRAMVGAAFARDHLLVTVTGDITPEKLAPALDRLFGALPAAGHLPATAETTPQHLGETLVVRRPMTQSILMMGEPGLKRADPDWFPAYVMNYVLGGGGFSSRLTEEVREKRGLTYGVYSYLYPYDHAALIIAGGSTKNSTAAEALTLIKAEWARMAESGITEKELADAKTYLTGSFPLQLSSSAAIARLVLQVRHDKLGIDYLNRRNGLIEAVTLEDVKRVAKRLLDPAKFAVVVVGQPEGVESTPAAAP